MTNRRFKSIFFRNRLAAIMLAGAVAMAGSSAFAAGETQPAASAAPKTTALTTQQIDAIGQKIDSLKQQVINLSGNVADLRDGVVYPPSSRMSVFISVTFATLLLHEITVTIDDGAPMQYTYSSLESRALRSGLQRLADLNLGAGTHKIHAEYIAYNEDYQLFEAPITGKLDTTFDKVAGVGTLELSINGSATMTPAGPGAPVTQLAVKIWSAQ